MIALIDYKAGNLTSVRKALATVGADVFTPEAAPELEKAAGIIVPGVGHFAATKVLDEPWAEIIRRLVGGGRPLLGICLGMQWLYEGSDEDPEHPGIGFFKGQCYRLGTKGAAPANGETVKVPHVGWNALSQRRTDSIVSQVPDQSQVYFTHSYVAPLTPETVAATEHGEPFASIVQRDNIAGVQFHPEKSGDIGLQVLRNFLAMIS